MAVTKKYKVFRRGKLIGEHTAVEAAAILKCTPGTVRCYASGGNKLYGEYTFEMVEPDPVCKAGKPWTMTKAQTAEWEVTRQQFLRSGVDLAQIKLAPKRD